MATLNFNCILLKLADQGSILQDGLNLGNIHFWPTQQTLQMQHISLDYLQGLATEGTFMPPTLEGTLDLSGTTAILLVFQADDQHEKITDIYVGLMVRHVKSRLYAPDRILDFVSDIEANLKVACNALKAGVTQARGTTSASLSTTMGAQCRSPWTCLTASFIP